MAATTNQNTYFDLHTRGIAYVNRFRVVTPKSKKTESFCAVTLGFLRGKAGKDTVEYTYIDCIIRNKEVSDLLELHKDAINDKNQKVLAVCTVGDIYAEAFTKRDSTISAGIKGRLIGMRQLKVNGEVVYSKSDDSDEQPAEEQNDAPVIQDEVAESAEAPVEHEALAPEVQLDPNAPDFSAQRDHLKKLGYVWDRDLKLWVLRQAA